AQALYVAAELRIADLLSDGPRTSAELASATGAHEPSLHRLLRALTAIDICKELPGDTFAITEMGSLLRADTPDSLRSWTIWWGSNLWQVWGNLLYSIKTGESARRLLTGKEGFGHLEQDAKAAAVFNQALAELTRLTAQNVVQEYDFSQANRIMDIGGGYGELLVWVLRANPQASGVLFDLPHAIDGARKHFEIEQLDSRCQFIAGDFFDSVPAGGDLYLLKSILHDWNDEKAKIILENCRRAMNGNGRLLLVERVLPERLENVGAHRAAVRSDLHMLVALAAQERSESAFKRLLDSSGFSASRFMPVGAGFNVIEAVPLR
ncbi:MAG: methyltransferase, partial [Terriglobales bacterium]